MSQFALLHSKQIYSQSLKNTLYEEKPFDDNYP